MSKSRLNVQISLCESVEQLNDKGCVETIRLLQQNLGSNDLNEFLIKIIIQMTNNSTINSLEKMDKEIKDILSNKDCYRQSNKAKNKKDGQEPVQETTFALQRLPIDLVCKTTLFLNEKDIFIFDQCCRFFYQMINNSTYLNKTNNFKTFEITTQRLNQRKNRNNINICRYNFYKYSKSHKLKFDVMSDFDMEMEHDDIEDYITNLFDKWDNIRTSAILDDWYETLFKSIESLTMSEDGTLLLDKLPIDILFNSSKSNLKYLEINNYWKHYVQPSLNKFEQQYSDLKNKLNEEENNTIASTIKKLECVKVHCTRNGRMHDSYIDTNHLFFTDSVNIFLEDVEIFYSPSIVTFISNIGVDSIGMKRFDNNNNNNKDDNNQIQIKTLRLMNFDIQHDSKIITNESVIKILNLDNSLKNLTLGYQWDGVTGVQAFEKQILKKQYYHNLENVNILVNSNSSESIDEFFELLKKNIQLLKHQFKQLNIGLCMPSAASDKDKYYILQWNSKITDKYLDNQHELFVQNDNISNNTQLKEKYQKLANQWTDGCYR